MIGNFSILCSCNTSSAPSKLIPSSAVISFPLVITFSTDTLLSFWNLKSRLVTMPNNFLLESTTGIPPILFSLMIFRASPTVLSICNVIGSKIIPLWERFTFLTSIACCSMVMFLWINPRPPSNAMAIAK